jgi:hypothetical protein
VVVGGDGAPERVQVERSMSSLEDKWATECLVDEMRRLRLPPFDGPSVRLTVPFTLR